ncbi:hypothetical protein BX286_3567 [Streptomyces sp. 3211.6]|uniref:DUF5994 family protein n=1 Tax=unclassified Streptomyces TaxID=2593676 RepID=UPI000EB43EA2|nr:MULTISPECIES: DUF5994 family protein [unclassified Streptomyces]RKT05567.1 hypothetical protein BX286_3567 [Streptomyces sp. 3211.6]RPF41501.1 hypothetical protein EDD96_5306 [Streptomyces sp. Ag109_G2-6]
MTSTTDPARQVRLALTPKTSLAGLLDGAWWPYSRDLAAELPALVDALEENWGRITRITANPDPWPALPYTVAVHGRSLNVGWFSEQDRDTMILFSYSLRRCDLLVVPPEAEPASAARLMAAASTPGNVHDTGVVMSAESTEAEVTDGMRRRSPYLPPR